MLQAQAASPSFTHVYAVVAAIISSKFPQMGELILQRLILMFTKSNHQNLKQQCFTASRFVAPGSKGFFLGIIQETLGFVSFLHPY